MAARPPGGRKAGRIREGEVRRGWEGNKQGRGRRGRLGVNRRRFKAYGEDSTVKTPRRFHTEALEPMKIIQAGSRGGN